MRSAREPAHRRPNLVPLCELRGANDISVQQNREPATGSLLWDYRLYLKQLLVLTLSRKPRNYQLTLVTVGSAAAVLRRQGNSLPQAK